MDNLATMTSAGDPAGMFYLMANTNSGQAGALLYADHNGENGLAYDGWLGAAGHGGWYYQTNTALGSIRANIGWSPTSGSANYMWADWAGAAPSTLVDASSVANWNNTVNGSVSSMYPSSTFNGTAYQINSGTATLGSHETHLAPKYIDTGRRGETWASRVMGQAQSAAGLKAALWGCPNISNCVGSLMAWVSRGWQPTNVALKGAAPDGKIIGLSGTYGSGYTGTCGVTITPRDNWDLGGSVASMQALATCTFVGGVPQVTLVNGGAHYRIATPAAVAITCEGCTPTVAASLTPIIQPSDIGPVPMVLLPSAF
jgi:hypothetical protein